MGSPKWRKSSYTEGATAVSAWYPTSSHLVRAGARSERGQLVERPEVTAA
jgi:hypothetical protein